MLPLRAKFASGCNSIVHLWKNILKEFANDKNYSRPFSFYCKYRGATHSIRNLRFNAPNEIIVVFHYGSNFDYYFIIIELANEFEGKFQCFGESTEKRKTFSVPIEKKSYKNW